MLLIAEERHGALDVLFSQQVLLNSFNELGIVLYTECPI